MPNEVAGGSGRGAQDEGKAIIYLWMADEVTKGRGVEVKEKVSFGLFLSPTARSLSGSFSLQRLAASN